MDLEQLYYLGELIGVVVVVASLIFVGLQLRQNTIATRATSHHAVADSINQVNLTLAQDAELSEIFNLGIADRLSLSEKQRGRFDLILLSYFHAFDTMFYQARTGAGDEGLLRAEEPGLKFLVSHGGVQSWWRENPYGFSPDFRAYIDNLILAAPS